MSEEKWIRQLPVIAEVSVAVLAIASVLAWIAAGRVLAPLRLLAETARSISESDLTQRIPVKGSDEIAELIVTFNEMLDRLQTAFISQRDFIYETAGLQPLWRRMAIRHFLWLRATILTF